MTIRRLVAQGALVYLLALLPFICGCGHNKPYYILPPHPDDVQLKVRNLHYDAVTSGYTFGYNEDDPDDPCEPTAWAYISKDALVATRSIRPNCFQSDADFTILYLRSDWNEPLKPTTRGVAETIPTLPARHPGR